MVTLKIISSQITLAAELTRTGGADGLRAMRLRVVVSLFAALPPRTVHGGGRQRHGRQQLARQRGERRVLGRAHVLAYRGRLEHVRPVLHERGNAIKNVTRDMKQRSIDLMGGYKWSPL